MEIGSDIVNKLGGGSGIDTRKLVNDLVSLQNAPEQQRLDRRQERLESQISDYGLLRSALAELESSVAALGSKDTFDAKSVSLPETSLLSLTELDSSAAAGTYQLKVEQTARAQSLSSTAYASADAEVGTGSLTLRFGDWNAALDAFTVDADKAGATIEIDETNNTLTGLRDAINEAGIGVQASIVSDDGQYRLQITSPTGATNELEIVATEEAGSPGLAAFAFNTTTQAMTQNQAGQDALIRVNGLLVARESNSVDDVIDGLSFDIFNDSTTETVNITISEDRNTAETAIRDFVEAYNTFLDNVKQLTGVNDETGEFGSLYRDSMADNLVERVRRFIGATVPGIGEGFSSLANLGIETNIKDGTLEINEDPDRVNTNFNAVFSNNYEMIRDLFVPQANSDNSKIQVEGFGSRTQPGDYAVEITQQATKGTLTGDPFTATFPLDTTAKDYSFDIVIDGISASVVLPQGVTYNTGTELAEELQSMINLDENIAASNASVSVAYTAGALSFTSDSYGKNSNVVIASVGADAAELGLAAKAGTKGTDVAGTVNGEEAFGFGNVLLPAIGSAAEGLKMIIKPGATEATVNFSRGFSGGMASMINSFLSNNGLISKREDNIDETLEDIEDDRAALERRTENYRARLQSQFLAMEMIVNNLSNTGTFLDGINDRLPFTAPK